MRKYILDPSNYKGSAENTMSGDYVDYCANLYGRNMTFEQYKEHKKNPNLVVMTWDELYPIHQKYENSLCKPWQEIDEKRWYEMLEVLPPGGWRDLNSRFNVFYCIEAYTGTLNSHFVKDRETGKYYEALRNRFSKNEDLLKELNELL